MKTKTILGYVLVGTSLIGAATYAAESTTTGTGVVQKISHMMRGKKFSHSGAFAFGSGGYLGGRGFEKGGFGMGAWMLTKLTDAEKTSLTTMTTEQKQAFFEVKRAAFQQAQDAKEAVITKLINGEALTDSEKTLLVTIKQERADMLAKRDTMKKQRAEIQALIQKKQSGTTLTADEQAKLNSFAPMGRGKGGMRGNQGGNQK